MDEHDWIDRLESLALEIQDHAITHPCGPDGCHICRLVLSTGEGLEHYVEAMRAVTPGRLALALVLAVDTVVTGTAVDTADTVEMPVPEVVQR